MQENIEMHIINTTMWNSHTVEIFLSFFSSPYTVCTIGLLLPTPPEVDEDTLPFEYCAQILGVNTIAPGRSVIVNLATQPGSAQGLCTVYII